jgi:hypothetical protein
MLTLLMATGCTADSATKTQAPTTHGDVMPILEARCTNCHYGGGVGGFALVAGRLGLLAALAQENGRGLMMM